MEDSHFSDPEYQVVLETEAEGLMVRDSERILERASPETRLKINLMFQATKTPDFPGTKDLSPAGPLTICGGTISGYPSYSYVQESGFLYSKELTTVIQESKTTTKPAAATATTEKTMGKVAPLLKIHRKRSPVPNNETSSIYFILPSYVEKHKAEIKMIIAQAKTKLWCNKFYNNIFSNVEFNIAFAHANSRNIKNMIVRTKL